MPIYGMVMKFGNFFQNEVGLVAIVEELGPHLTDIVVGKRKVGLSFLAKILTLISRECLNEASTSQFRQCLNSTKS